MRYLQQLTMSYGKNKIATPAQGVGSGDVRAGNVWKLSRQEEIQLLEASLATV